MKGRVALIGCPKLDDNDAYVQKLSDILSANPIKDITLVHMEVPCCRQLKRLVLTALQRSGQAGPDDRVRGQDRGRRGRSRPLGQCCDLFPDMLSMSTRMTRARSKPRSAYSKGPLA